MGSAGRRCQMGSVGKRWTVRVCGALVLLVVLLYVVRDRKIQL